MIRVCDVPGAKSRFLGYRFPYEAKDGAPHRYRISRCREESFGVQLNSYRETHDPPRSTSPALDFREHLFAHRCFALRAACWSGMVVVSILLLRVRSMPDSRPSSPEDSQGACESHGLRA